MLRLNGDSMINHSGATKSAVSPSQPLDLAARSFENPGQVQETRQLVLARQQSGAGLLHQALGRYACDEPRKLLVGARELEGFAALETLTFGGARGFPTDFRTME